MGCETKKIFAARAYSSIVVLEVGRVPPVLVEHTITKAEHLSPGVQPAMQEREEANQQEERTGKMTIQNGPYKGLKRDMLLVEVLKDWNTESDKDIVDIKQ